MHEHANHQAPQVATANSAGVRAQMKIYPLSLVGVIAAGMLLAGCQTVDSNSRGVGQATQLPKELNDTRWQLEALVSSDDAIGTVRPNDPSMYQMQLNADGTANLKLDCNRANGPWSYVKSADGISGTFNIGPAAMTMAMCPPGSLDTRIGMELHLIRSYTLKAGRLNLSLMADGGIQIWAPLDGPKK